MLVATKIVATYAPDIADESKLGKRFARGQGHSRYPVADERPSGPVGLAAENSQVELTHSKSDPSRPPDGTSNLDIR